jgi:hypothetical protein
MDGRQERQAEAGERDLLSAWQSVRIRIGRRSAQVHWMGSRVYGVVLGIAALGLLLGALVFGLRPQAQEEGENEADQVSPSELALYIDVYTAMQANHDLTLDGILAQKGVPLEQFRNIERRIQKQDRLVRKVREALQTQAKARADTLAPPAPVEAPPANAPPPKTPPKK